MATLNKQQIAELISALEDMDREDLLNLSHSAAGMFLKKIAASPNGTIKKWEVRATHLAADFVNAITLMDGQIPANTFHVKLPASPPNS